MQTIRVAVADDHPLIRIGLERVLSTTEGMRLAAQFQDAVTLALADLSEVDVLLLDLTMSGANGVGLLVTLLERHPDLKVIVFSMLSEESFAPRVIAAGAAAFVHKNRPPEELTAVIRAVHEQGMYISDRQRELMLALEAVERGARHKGLSSREFEILLAVANGNKPTEIAKGLRLKVGTVTTHIHRIKKKLGARSLGELVGYGHRHGLV